MCLWPNLTHGVMALLRDLCGESNSAKSPAWVCIEDQRELSTALLDWGSVYQNDLCQVKCDLSTVTMYTLTQSHLVNACILRNLHLAVRQFDIALVPFYKYEPTAGACRTVTSML